MEKITKIKLSNGQLYTIFDTGAIRLNEQGILVTGNQIVDEMILNGHLFIKQIDDIDVAVSNVLTQDVTSGQIKRRDANKLLKDIGGASYKLDEDNGVLSLKIGKQTED